MPRRVRVEHGSEQFDVVVGEGMTAAELGALLERRTMRDGVVGLVEVDSGAVIGLSVACQSPEVLTADCYELLFSTNKPTPESIHRLPSMQSFNLEQFKNEEDEEEMWLTQAHLLMGVTMLEDKGSLDGDVADVLRHLVSDGDERMLAAMHTYEEDRDWEDFTDTLRNIAKMESTSVKMEMQGVNGGGSTGSQSETHSSEKEDDLIVNKELFFGVLISLHKQGSINKSETLILKRLAEMENNLVKAAAHVFEETQDEDDFVDTTKRIADHYSIEHVLMDLVRLGYIELDESRALALMFREANSLVTVCWKAYCEHRDMHVFRDQLLTILIFHDKKRFLMKMGNKGILSSKQVTRLCELLDQGNNEIMEVFSNLLEEGDLETALSSLKKLCQNEEFEILDVLLRFGKITEMQHLVLKTLAQKQDHAFLSIHKKIQASKSAQEDEVLIRELKQLCIAVASEDEGFRTVKEEEGGEEENIGSFKVPRQLQKVPSGVEDDKRILDDLLAMVASNALAPEEAGVLGTLVMTRDPKLLAAWDVYRIDGDLDDLTDTLSRIALKELSSRSLEEIEQYLVNHEEEDDDDDDDDDLDDDDEDGSQNRKVTDGNDDNDSEFDDVIENIAIDDLATGNGKVQDGVEGEDGEEETITGGETDQEQDGDDIDSKAMSGKVKPDSPK